MREEQERYIETYRAMGTKKEKYCKRKRKMSKEENFFHGPYLDLAI